jgi:hypothetical protein
MGKRTYKRFTKRVEVEFRSGGRVFKGISSDISENGLFVRTRNSLVPGSPVEMRLYLPDGTVSRIKGLVRRAVRTHSTVIKSGMGIEVLEYDKYYGNFLKDLVGGLKGPDLSGSHAPDEDAGESAADRPKSRIIACPSCGVKNRIPAAKLSQGPRCGKCKEALIAE